jgi:hypothetical protein
MGLDDWYLLFQYGSVVAGILATACLVATTIAGLRVSKRDGSRLVQLETDLTKARTDLSKQQEITARAESELISLRKGLDPRGLNTNALALALREHPPGKAIIFYQPNDSEAQALATLIFLALIKGGWAPQDPEPIPSDFVAESMANQSPEVLRKMTPVLRAGGASYGVSLIGKTQEKGSPWEVLYNAFQAVGLRDGGFSRQPALPADTVRIIVGPKPVGRQ